MSRLYQSELKGSSMRGFTRGRQRTAVFVVALIVLSVGVSVGLAKSGPGQIKSNVSPREEFDCPLVGDQLKKSAGKVTINNEKGAWTISVHLRGAVPGQYHIDLLDSNCVQFEFAVGGFFKVKSDGSGDKTVPYSASGFQSFYVQVHEPRLDIGYFTPLLKIGGNSS
jgi:hypothetical protein